MKWASTLLLCLTCSGLSLSAAGQQTYPNRPMRLIVASSPGGPNDIIGRILAQPCGEILGQQIVVDNRAGATGLIGTELGAKAAPDGYTLLLGFSGPLVMAPHLEKSLPYDTLKDFTPVSLAVNAPYVLLVNPSLPAKSVKELVALAKAQPGKLNYASGGGGGGLHLAAELFNLTAGVKITHVPYKGGAPGMTALMASEVHMMFSGLSAAVPHIKSGKLRALAVGGSKRFPLVPDVPTVAESGFPFSASGWYGVLAPRNTPQAIVTRLNRTLVRVLSAPAMKERLNDIAIEPVGSTPEEFARLLREEMVTWGKVIRAAGLKSG